MKKKTAMKWQSLRTDKFNNSCNDEKCCEKPNETINPTPESIASLRLL